MKKYSKDIAIVGMACRFPGAVDYTQYWQNLVAKKNTIQEVPKERWDVSEYYSSTPNSKKSISKWCGLIDDIRSFDNAFFNISPLEAKNMDPQQRLLLQESWRCIEDSAISLKQLQQAKTSVYVGAMTSDYLQTLNKNQTSNNRYSILGNDHCILANRVSHQLNLRGESISINAASASSLVAIHKAKSALVMGECDYAIAAGVNLNTDPFKYIVFSQAGMLSPDGQCRSFSDDANGYVPGDGVAAILLQPLDKALAHNNHVYGVIKGSAINHIGSGKAITAPCADAQTEVIRESLRNAAISPEKVTYIEAHGSGTPLGDPVEIEAISRIFNPHQQKIVIGTVKPNIGHLEAAAGIAGVIKALLVLKHKYLPANLNLKQINPVFNLENSKIQFANGQPLNIQPDTCVGISSFGFGGVSCHLTLQAHLTEHKLIKKPVIKHIPRHFLLSAKSEQSLQMSVVQWRTFLRSERAKNLLLKDICATLATGREAFPFRMGCVARTKNELLEQLSLSQQSSSPLQKPLLSYVFAGVKGLPLSNNNPLIAQHYDTLKKQVIIDLESGRVNHSVNPNSNPVINNTLAAIATFRALKSVGVEPDHIGWNQEGIWAALICAEIITVKDFCDVVSTKKQASEIVFYQPKYPIRISGNGPMVYPHYINTKFIHYFFKEIMFNSSDYQGVIKQAQILMKSRSEFKNNLAQWNVKGNKGQDVIQTINAFSSIKFNNLKQIAYAVIAANVNLNLFYQKWKFECESTKASYYISILSRLIQDGLLSAADCYQLIHTREPNKLGFLASFNEKNWREINQLICKNHLNEHQQVLSNCSALVNEIEGLNQHSISLMDSSHRRINNASSYSEPTRQAPPIGSGSRWISIGCVSHQYKHLIDNELINVAQWQQLMLDVWQDGHQVDWTQLYRAKDFKRLALPGYMFEQTEFWPQPLKSPQSNAELNGSVQQQEAMTMGDRKSLDVIQADGKSKDRAVDQVNSHHKALDDLSGETDTASAQANQVKPKAAEESDLRHKLVSMVADQLLMQPEQIDIHASFDQYGLDSMAYTQLSESINRYFQISLTPACFYGFKDIQSLISRVTRETPVERFKLNVNSSQPSQDTEGEVLQETEKLNALESDDKTKDLEKRTATTSETVKDSIENRDIAIVGYAGHLPNATTLDIFWQNLLEGIDAISEIPSDRWDWRAYFSTDYKKENKTPSKWGGFITGIELFDAAFFGISPQEARLMDPQQRLLLQTAWHAIEHSGHSPAELEGSNTGVFIGASTSDYEELLRDKNLAAHASTGMNRSILANRISYLLDLHGPSEVIDTACSSSLVAIHKAIESIKAGHCTQALAGGVNALITPTHYISYGKAGMLSPHGRCKTFDADADGYVRAEGVGVVVLKSVEQARNDRDSIYAVVKASGMNHGGRASALTAPNPNAQAQLIVDTYQQADIDFGSIDYIENHGTGTPLGDPIEINGLIQANEQLKQPKQAYSGHQSNTCYLASVKSNIGHLEAAAGVAGVLKILLALKHQILPASQHCKQINPFIKLEDQPFEILRKNKKWPSRLGLQNKRRAGVSSFGFGGVNAHLVLEEADQLVLKSEDHCSQTKQLILISAKTETALRAYAESMLHYIGDNKTSHLFKHVAFTSQLGRKHERYRMALLAKDFTHLSALIEQLLKDKNLQANELTDSFYGVQNSIQPSDVKNSQIESSLRSEDLESLAKLWVQGTDIDWLQLYGSQSNLRRVAIPTYPFQQKKYWVDTAEKPLEIDFQEQPKGMPFKIAKHSYLSQQHIVNGAAICPGVFSINAFFEYMCRQNTAKAIALSHVFWLRPIAFNNDDKHLIVSEASSKRSKLLQVCDDSPENTRHTVYAEAQVANVSEHSDVKTHALPDLNTFEAIKDSYQKLKTFGFHYGQQFQVIHSKSLVNADYWYELRMPEIKAGNTLSDDEYALDPRLMDGGLQACLISLIDAGFSANYIPMLIEHAIIHQALPEQLWIKVRHLQAPDKEMDSLRFDVQYMDKNGMVCIEFSGLTFKYFKQKNPTQVTRFNQVSEDAILSVDTLERQFKPLAESQKLTITSTTQPIRNKKNEENQEVNSKQLMGKTVDYLLTVIAEQAAIEKNDIDIKQPFKEYGIDSFLTLSIIRHLQEDFGELRKTLLFEASNVEELAQLFIEEFSTQLVEMFGLSKASEVIDTNQAIRESSTQIESRDESIQPRKKVHADEAPIIKESKAALQSFQVFKASELNQQPEVAQQIASLFKRYGAESIALSRKDIAPFICVTTEGSSLFYFNVRKDLLLAFRYLGAEQDFAAAIDELSTYAEHVGLHMNVLCEYVLDHAIAQKFSINSFGVVQRISDLSQFTLEGKKMRRLRYQVNKFDQSGHAQTIEYQPCSDGQKDDSIARMIEKWAQTKTGVNPYIWRVKEEMETGCLGDAYRVFLTYLDQTLQNVVIVSRIDSANSYLLDTEFYSAEMAPGAMDYAIYQIIQQLYSEGCSAFSLGLTFGSSFCQSPKADSGLASELQKLAEQQIFEEPGNFQFKNKFRSDNSPLYIYRTAGQSAANILDVIMMIGNPTENELPGLSDKPSQIAQPLLQKSTNNATVQEKVDTAGLPESQTTMDDQAQTDSDRQTEQRALLLANAGFNPFNLARHHIEFDLATDSWSELEYGFIGERTQWLQSQKNLAKDTVETLLSQIFGMPHILPFSAGRVAESFFCPAWPKQKKYVIQNVLFPTCLFHQVNNEFIPIEITHEQFHNRKSDFLFKGDIDCQELEKHLQTYAEDIAFIWIELANNASGGCPVSLQNLKQVKAMIGDIPLVLDATRIIENAYHIKAYESAYAQWNVWDIVTELCRYADCVNASLTKDFGTHTGGFIATRDAALHADILDAISTNGSGLSQTDRALICHALNDKDYILSAVSNRMNYVQSFARKLIDAGIEVVQPVGGHCVLIDPMRIPGLKDMVYPLPSFVSWLYERTGIRAGLHSVGRQRNTPMNDLIRLAIPVGLSQQQTDEIAERISRLFAQSSRLNVLDLKNKPQGLFGEMKAHYAVSGELLVEGDHSHTKPVESSFKEENSDRPEFQRSSQQTKGKVSETTDSKAQADQAKQPIAVIGMAGRYPDADNLEQFWNNLLAGKNSIKRGPNWAERGQAKDTEQHFGGFIDNVDKFDSLFFSISPREAENMDPQERLVMEVSWEALEDAGYFPESLGQQIGSNDVGVFVGAVWSHYETLGAENRQRGGHSVAHSQHWGISNRVSSFMNFNGPSLTVDTACSSSLTAIHLACEALHNGECSVALSGGVNLDIHPSKYHITKAAQFLSEDGLCRAFGKDGSGYVAGEGVGVLLLKPLAQAQADGDHIYGVIKSSVVNHGGRTAGYTVPSPKAQAALISTALTKAKINPETINYIEAHGTGTELGDPVEIEGISQAFKKHTQRNQYCAIGSVKTNIGHLEAAAGIAGATKLLLQMKHKKIVASLHSERLNDHIDFRHSPVFVQQEVSYWQPVEHNGTVMPRRAGLSSFGAGGTNVHIIFEEYLHPQTSKQLSSEQQLIIVSARKPEQLMAQAQQLCHYLINADKDKLNLSEVAYTLQTGRLAMTHRLAFVSQDISEAIERLEQFISGKPAPEVMVTEQQEKMALAIFDGDETQQLLQVLLNNNSLVKIARLWVNGIDIDWSQFNKHKSLTRVSLPTYPFAKETHWIPQIAGSGEVLANSPVSISASSVTSAIHPLLDANCSTLSQPQYRKQFNLNQFIFSDHIVNELPTLPGVAYMEMARAAAQAASGVKVTTLKNLIWASPINSEVSDDIRILLNPKNEWVDYEICTYDKNSKQVHSQGKALCQENDQISVLPKDIDAIKSRCSGFMSQQACYDLLLTRQLRYGEKLQAIRGFHFSEKEGLTRLELPTGLAEGFNDYIAHPSILDGAVQSIISLLECVNTQTQPGVPYVPFVLGELSILKPLTPNAYAHLVLEEAKKERDDIKKIHIDILSPDGDVLIQMKDFSFKAIADDQQQNGSQTLNTRFSETQAVNNTVFYHPQWKAVGDEQTPELAMMSHYEEAAAIVVFDNSVENSKQIHSIINSESVAVITVSEAAKFSKIDPHHYQINALSAEDYQRLIDGIIEDGYKPQEFIHYLSQSHFSAEQTDVTMDLNQGLYSIVNLTQCILKNRKKINSKIININYLHHFIESNCNPCFGAISAFFKSIKQEGANVNCQSIGLENKQSNLSRQDWIILLNSRHHINGTQTPEFSYKGTTLYEKYLDGFDANQRSNTNSTHLAKTDGVYLITGGLGGLGVLFAKQLCRQNKITVVLSGRTQLNTAIEAQLEQLRMNDCTIDYLSCDLNEMDSVKHLVSSVVNKYGALNGVIHAAGLINDGFLWNKELEQFKQVLGPKVMGTQHLDQATKNINLDYMLLCSSIASTHGNMGQSDYAAGNRFMDDFAVIREQWRKTGLRKGQTVSINWPLWRNGGMQVNAQAEQWLLENWGMQPLDTEIGLMALDMSLGFDLPSFGLVQGDVAKIKEALSIQDQIHNQAENPSEPQHDPVVSALSVQEKNTVTLVKTSNDALTIEKSNALSAGDVRAQLQSDLTQMVVDLLKIKQSDIEFSDNMSTYGFDSVTFTEFTNLINNQLTLDITPLIFFEQETLDELSDYLMEECAEELSAHYAQKTAVSADLETEQTSEESKATTEVNNSVRMASVDEGDQKIQENHEQKVSTDPSDFLTSEQQTQPKKTIANNEPIAIIGLSGVMPQSKDVDHFWQNLIEEKNLITEIPKDRWDWQKFYGESDLGNSKTEIKWGGFMPNVDKFDADFFNISPLEAELTDPQQRIFLENVWHTIEDAGYKASDLSGSNTGVFVGIGSSDYHELLREQSSDFEAYSVAGWMHAVLANRISYFFNWSGPSEPIGTACSSTLVAIDRAVRAIRSGQCDLSIAGGVSMLLNPGVHVGLGKASMLADDGMCKTFDHRANGYVRSEGVGSLLLKPLSQAKADGDRIYAVIKGTAVNHGGHVNTFTTPNPKAQADVLSMAFEDANVDPATLSYIETHGTGTALGDPIEIQGLIKAFGKSAHSSGQMPEQSGYCTLGSVKTNAGHLELASGMSGMLKLILALQKKVIPANINFEKVNPYIKLDSTPFVLAEKTKSWDRLYDLKGNAVPRRAGISSFGFGGVNAHLVLEEYESETKQQPLTYHVQTNNKPQLIAISTKHTGGLKSYANAVVNFIETNQNQALPEFGDFAAGWQQGKEVFAQRLICISGSYRQLLEQLKAYIGGHKVEGVYDNLENEKTSQKPDSQKFKALIEQVQSQRSVQAAELKAMAQFWLDGGVIRSEDWHILNPRKEKVSLPAYPFQRNRYWLLTSEYTGADYSQDKLIDSENLHESEAIQQQMSLSDSTIKVSKANANGNELVYDIQFNGENDYCDAHQISGLNILPAAVYLEILNYTAQDLFASSITEFTDIHWLAAMTKADQMGGIKLELMSEGEGMQFSFMTASDTDPQKIFCKGIMSVSAAKNTNPGSDSLRFDVNALSADSLNKHSTYDVFSQNGFNYGARLQVIDHLDTSSDTVMSVLSKSQINKNNSFDAALIDGALQTILGVLLFQSKEKQTKVPVSAGQVIRFKPTTEKMYVSVTEKNLDTHLQSSQMANEMSLFEISLYDASGELAMLFSDVTVTAVDFATLNSVVSSPSEENKPSILNNALTDDQLKQAVAQHMVQMIATETKREISEIANDSEFNSLGVDSFLALRMTKQLEKIVGPIAKTVFFEHTNLNSLTTYLFQNHKPQLSQYFIDADQLSTADTLTAEPLGENDAVSTNAQQQMVGLDASIKQWLREMVAQETKRDIESIAEDAGFDSLGIDSFLALRMTKQLEKIVGPVAKTVFFEHASLSRLSAHLHSLYATELGAYFADNNIVLNEPMASENDVEGTSVDQQSEDIRNEDIAVQIDEHKTTDLLSKVLSFLVDMVAEETKREAQDIKEDSVFESLGVDSFLALRMTKKLEKIIGTIEKTVFFEYTSPALLAEYLMQHHGDQLNSYFANYTETVAVKDKVAHNSSEINGAEDLSELTTDYLRKMVAEESKRSVNEVLPDSAFDSLGIDSFLALRMTKKLEKLLGPIAKTVFFEHNSLDSLSAYLVSEYTQALSKHFKVHAREEQMRTVSVNQQHQQISAHKTISSTIEHQLTRASDHSQSSDNNGQQSQLGYCVIKESDLQKDNSKYQLIQQLCSQYGRENKALARGAIAPLIFIGSTQTAYFNFNHNEEVAFAFTYVGSEDDFVELANEFATFCKDKGLLVNMLTEHPIGDTGRHHFSSNPFAVMQRMTDIKSLTLKGSKMRRLRYQLTKFEQSGQCELSEYTIGQDPSIDQSIANMIDLWAENKDMVNPYIWEVKAQISEGVLPDSHRVFLTRIDGELQNVIIITKLASENGYLMDLEFYPKSMPLGGLEYAIWNILQILIAEGCDVFSLGATFGVSAGDESQADPKVVKTLADLQEQGAFDGHGNLQFKNKFRPENATLYLSRLMHDDAEKVIDVIMLIANPNSE